MSPRGPAGPCLLCLSSLSGEGTDRDLTSLLKLIQIDSSTQFRQADDDARHFVLCPECDSLYSSAEALYAEFSQIKVRLKTEIVAIRGKILESEGKLGITKEINEIFRMRESFLDLSGKIV